MYFTSNPLLNCAIAPLLQSWDWLLCGDTRYSVICSIRRLVYRHWPLDVHEEKLVTKYGALWKCMFYRSSVLVTVWIQRQPICSCFPPLRYNSEHRPLCLSNSTVTISSQKCLTRSQTKALQSVSLLRVHKISCMQLYRIVTSNRRFPVRNCSHARILTEFKGLIPLLCLKFQKLKKMLPVMKQFFIYQTHILHPSVNEGVTAE